MKKRLVIRIILGLVVLIIVAFVVVAFSLGAIVKKGIETVGPNATQTEVRLKSAQVWLFAGRAELNGFFIGNPKGYKTDSAVVLDDVSVGVKPGSVFSDKIIVTKVVVKAPVITLEGSLNNNNLTQIEKNLNDYMGGSTPASKAATPPAAQAKANKKLQVNDLEITGAKIQVNTMLSGGKTVTLPIPDVHLTDLGTGPEGITPLELAQKALHEELSAALSAVAKNAGQLGADALKDGKGAVDKGMQSIKGLIH